MGVSVYNNNIMFGRKCNTYKLRKTDEDTV